MSAARTCRVAGCTNTHPRTHVMCRAHWREVPGELQRAVYRAYRGDSLGDHLQAMENAIAHAEHRDPEDLLG